MRIRFYDNDGRYITARPGKDEDSVIIHNRREKMPKINKKTSKSKALTDHAKGLQVAYSKGELIGYYQQLQMFADLVDSLGNGDIDLITVKLFKGTYNLSWCSGNAKDSDNWDSVQGNGLIELATQYQEKLEE